MRKTNPLIDCYPMSDGNYNRNLLPYKPYESGLRAGRAQMREKALQAFTAWLQAQGFDAEMQKQHLLQFRALLGL